MYYVVTPPDMNRELASRQLTLKRGRRLSKGAVHDQSPAMVQNSVTVAKHHMHMNDMACLCTHLLPVHTRGSRIEQRSASAMANVQYQPVSGLFVMKVPFGQK